MRLALATCAALTLASAAVAQTSVQDRYGPPRRAAVATPAGLYAPSPVQVAAAAAAPARAAAPAAHPIPAAPAVAGGSRMYSLHRQYGIAPDAIPKPPTGSGYVLIGPAEGAEAPADAAKSPSGSASDPQF